MSFEIEIWYLCGSLMWWYLVIPPSLVRSSWTRKLNQVPTLLFLHELGCILEIKTGKGVNLRILISRHTSPDLWLRWHGFLSGIHCLSHSLINYPPSKPLCSKTGRNRPTVNEWIRQIMMTSSNGTIFRVTGHLCGKFTGPRWISCTKASDAELWCLLWSTLE